MKLDLTLNIVKVRISVAFLGEKDQQNWWSSSFLSKSGEAFLTPVFPKTSQLSRVTGASAAARVIHDEHIGVGDVFHLFRLPENIEHDISQVLTNELTILSEVGSENDAYAALEELTEGEPTQSVGPLLLDQSDIDQTVISQMAAAYLSGFKSKQQVYPYYRGKS